MCHRIIKFPPSLIMITITCSEYGYKPFIVCKKIPVSRVLTNSHTKSLFHLFATSRIRISQPFDENPRSTPTRMPGSYNHLLIL
jgi:hypothetical protein